MRMIEKTGGEDLEWGLGEERRDWRPQGRPVARSRFEFSALTYKPVACKEAPGEEAKRKLTNKSEPTITNLKNSEREVRQPVSMPNEPEPPSESQPIAIAVRTDN